MQDNTIKQKNTESKGLKKLRAGPNHCISLALKGMGSLIKT